MRLRNDGTIDIQADDRSPTNRVVRSFKPSKTKKLPELARNFENKLSQLADSNVTPLGLFNQDLHAKREWNKLMEQKNFNATVNERSLTLQRDGADDFLPMSPLTDANRTTQVLLAQGAANSPHETVTRNNSHDESDDVGESREDITSGGGPRDNSTLQSHASRLHVQRMHGYERPKIQLMSHNAI